MNSLSCNIWCHLSAIIRGSTLVLSLNSKLFAHSVSPIIHLFKSLLYAVLFYLLFSLTLIMPLPAKRKPTEAYAMLISLYIYINSILYHEATSSPRRYSPWKALDSSVLYIHHDAQLSFSRHELPSFWGRIGHRSTTWPSALPFFFILQAALQSLPRVPAVLHSPHVAQPTGTSCLDLIDYIMRWQLLHI